MAEYSVWGLVVDGTVLIYVFSDSTLPVTIRITNLDSAGKNFSNTRPPAPLDKIGDAVESSITPFLSMSESAFEERIGAKFADTTSVTYLLYDIRNNLIADTEYVLWPKFELTNDGATLRFTDIPDVTGYEVYRNGVKIADIK